MGDKRGRPKGTVKNRVTTAVLEDWADVYNEGGDAGKAVVLERIEKLGLDKDIILERMAHAYYKNRDKRRPELAQVARQEIDKSMAKVRGVVREGAEFKKLAELAPLDNLVIDLRTLEVKRIRRPVPRLKK